MPSPGTTQALAQQDAEIGQRLQIVLILKQHLAAAQRKTIQRQHYRPDQPRLGRIRQHREAQPGDRIHHPRHARQPRRNEP
ncbi:MAG: hypothetical protein IPL70_11845 [Uliginosibacterium sp.]|nr:hypothetical protein [Uliginosibacterium sp.]